MRITLRNLTILATTTLISLQNFAQDRFAYAITDQQPNTAGWTVIRKVNTQTGEFGDVLLNGFDGNKIPMDATSKKALNNSGENAYQYLPFSTGVAAMAYDKKNDRLYYTPMFLDQLRYVDLKTMQVYYVTTQTFSKLGNLHNSESKIVSRMVITESGDGYAISNDGYTFIHFTTGKKPQTEVLGSLTDDPSNKDVSVHTKCTGWGGDLIADNEGKLYLLSAHNNIFKIDPDTKVAKHIATISGLPEYFTTNGAVVTEDQQLLVASQFYNKAWYTVNPKDWTATEYKTPAGVYLSSDLANSNVLNTRKNPTTIATIENAATAANNNVQVYPNPVINHQFNVQLSNLASGDYTIELNDVNGKLVLSKKVNINGKVQLQNVQLNGGTANGIYLVKVVDASGKQVYTQKIVLQ